MRVYKTSQGDAWDLIAHRLYPDAGREMCMAALLAANPKYREIVIFSAGAELVAPDIAAPTVQNLPPWKKRGAARARLD